jgi:zinc protease
MMGDSTPLIAAPAPAPDDTAFFLRARNWRLSPMALTPVIALDWQKQVLENGLTVVVHPDPDSQMVRVDIGYRAGAMDEPADQTGLSHLFEHLMFSGTERFPDHYITRLLEAGATEVNAMTSHDMTHYFQTAPAAMLDLILDAEADRMATCVASLDSEKFEQQRKVVLEEKRENESKPMGMVNNWLAEGLLRPGHPRRHPVIGHVKDIEALTLEQAKAWGGTRYVPANAVLVVAGGVEPDQVFAKARHHFAAIPPGRRLYRTTRCVEPAPGGRAHVALPIGLAAIAYAAWNVSSVCDAPREQAALSLLARFLAGDGAAPLHRHFVGGRAVATDVGADLRQGRGCGEFVVHVGYTEAVPAGGDPAGEIAALVAAVLDAPLDADRLESVRVGELAHATSALTLLENRAATLMEGEMACGDPGWFAERARLVGEIEEDEIRRLARRWLACPAFGLLIERTPALSAAAPADPKAAQTCSAAPVSLTRPRLPAWREARLSCGARVRVSHRPRDLRFAMRAVAPDSGLMAESAGLEGLATLAASFTALGAGPDDAARLGNRMARAGLTGQGSAQIDALRLDVAGPTPSLPAAVALLADAILQPRFDTSDFASRFANVVATARLKQDDPRQLAVRAQFAALFGPEHRMARAAMASANLPARAGAAEVEAFHRSAFDPERTLLLVAGNVSLEEIVPLLDVGFSGWAMRTPQAQIPTPSDAPSKAGGVRFFEVPGATSAELAARWLVGQRDQREMALLGACHYALCGDFRSRANQLLRETHGWSYGVLGMIYGLQPGRWPYVGTLDTAVDVEHAGDAIGAVRELIARLRSDQPPTLAEIDSYRRNELLRLGRYGESPHGVLDALEALWREPEDALSLDQYCDSLEALDPASVAAAARWALPDPDEIAWTVTGDAARARATVSGVVPGISGWEGR